MNIRDPRIQKYIMAAILVLGLQYAFFFVDAIPFGFKAKRTEINALKAEYGKLSSEINQARRLTADMDRVEALHKTTQMKWEIANELLPPSTDMAGLLRAMTIAGSSAGVDFVGFEPNDSVNLEYYAENPVTVTVIGGYHEVGAFFSEVARLSRLVTVRMPKIETLTGGEPSETVKAEFLASAYSVTGDHVRAKQVSTASAGRKGSSRKGPPKPSASGGSGAHIKE